MKRIFKIFPVLIAAALVIFMASGCEKDARDTAFGNDATLIYMPQATFAGTRYLVPSGRDSATFNYKIDPSNNKVNILLGVYGSGSQAPSAYAVNVSANADTISSMITSGALPAATTVILPAGIFTLPSLVSVKDGERGVSFYLSVDQSQLKTYTGKKLAIQVQLSNPSKYKLNTAINKTIVIIDVDALKL